MYFYFIWKHCHSKVVIFPMPHEQKDKEKKKNCVKTVKDYLFKTIIIFQTTFGGTYMLCKIKISF